MLVFCFGYFRKGNKYLLFILFWKCSCICDKIYLNFFGSIPNAIFVAYAIVKRLHDELFICCMTLAYLYNNCSAFVNFKNNYMTSLANAFVNGIFDHTLYNVNKVWKCIFWLKSNDYCWWKHVGGIFEWFCLLFPWLCECIIIHIIEIIIFSLYNIYIVVPKCWSLSYPFGIRSMFSSYFVN